STYPSIDPERLYDPEFKPDQLAKLKVSVMGVDYAQDLGDSDRDNDDEEFTVAVTIQKHTDRSKREMDDLCRLAKAVFRRCFRAVLTTTDGSRVVATGARFDPLYSVDMLRDQSTFWSGILVTVMASEVA